MRKIDIENAVNELKDFHEVEIVREFESFSFAEDFEQAKNIFTFVWEKIDKTSDFKWIPEYDKIAHWMVNTNGKGLLLIGDKGRGKTNIISHIVPVLFKTMRKVIKPMRSVDINLKNLEEIKKKNYIAVDEIGTEPKLTNFGEPFWAVNDMVDHCESKCNLFFGNTNLGVDQILSRYGDRTLDRFSRLCVIIEFKGDSFRE